MADAPARRGRSWMRLVGGSASPDLRHEFSTRGLAAVGLLDNSTPSSPSYVDRAAPLRPDPTMVGDVAGAGGVSRRGRRWRQSIAPEASPPVRSPALVSESMISLSRLGRRPHGERRTWMDVKRIPLSLLIVQLSCTLSFMHSVL
ncbi:hypothetical protein EJB05_34220, partial [Eragrostis curvula]